MGLRCSVLGHQFDETEVEREREDEGSEVVLTVREYEVCSRCGERDLVSENTEVTTAEHAPSEDAAELSAETDSYGVPEDEPPEEAEDAAAAVFGDDGATIDPEESDATSVAATDEPLDDAADEPAADAADDPAGDDAAILDDEEADDGEAEAAPDDAPDPDESADDDAVIEEAEPGSEDAEIVTEAEPEAQPTGVTPEAADDGPDPAEDDGVILDDEDDEPRPGDREHGEWPEMDDTRTAAGTDADDEFPTGDGIQAGDDGIGAGEDTIEGGTDGIEADEDPAATASDSVAAAEDPADSDATTADAPTEGDEEGYDAEFIDGADGRTAGQPEEPTVGESGITSAGSVTTPTERSGDGPTEFYCPECGHTAPRQRTSLRAGDICPECKRGYLSERDA